MNKFWIPFILGSVVNLYLLVQFILFNPSKENVNYYIQLSTFILVASLIAGLVWGYISNNKKTGAPKN